MAENSSIEWTDHTFNPWIGCTKVGPGCENCYAAVSTPARSLKIQWGTGSARYRTAPSTWKQPQKWNRDHDDFFAAHGRRQRVFCASLADWLDNEVPIAWFVELLDLIRTTPNLDWLLLTKRIGNFDKRMEEAKSAIDFDAQRDLWLFVKCWRNGEEIPSQVWLGATIVNQEEADRDIPKLLAVPAAKRFLSMEPLLSPVNIVPFLGGRSIHCGCGWRKDESDLYGATIDREKCRVCDQRTESGPTLDWVIVGGESGPEARPMHPAWVRGLHDQCSAANVPFLFKQWGEFGTKATRISDGIPVFREFDSYQRWVNKAQTWINGGICLDRHGTELKNGADMARARDADAFPVTIMHKLGKKAAGRLLDGVLHDGVPGVHASGCHQTKDEIQ